MPSNKERYIAFAAETPALPLCFHPWYLDAVCEGGKWNVAIVTKQERIVAVWPYFLKKKWGIRYIAMPMLTKWMGPCLVPDAQRDSIEEKAILDELMDQLPRVAWMTVDCHPDFQRPMDLTGRGFTYEERITYRLVGNETEWEAGMKDNTVRDLRKAAKTLVVSEEGSLALFAAIHEKTYARQGIPSPVPRDFLLRHLESLKTHKALRLTFARDDQGRVHSVLALTWDRRSAYYHIAGNDHAAGHSGGSKFLARDAMAYTTQTLGLKTFDFEGSMIKNVAQVWRRFGATPVPYYRLQYFRFRWLERLHNLLRNGSA